MNRSQENTVLLREKFRTYFPGGHSNLKEISDEMTSLVSHAEGSRFWDLNGKEYVDYSCANGPNILGHGHPEYIRALENSIKTTAICFGASLGYSENDVIAAQKLIKHVPCAEKVKFSISGTEAVQSAMRIARSYTGRPYVLVFKGHYHGWADNVMGIEPSLDDKPKTVAKKGFLGRAPGAEKGMLMIDWNDIDAFQNTLEKYGEQIAVTLMEPFAAGDMGMLPRPGYLEKVRELCTEYGVVLCFDEVFTGFRAGLNCAQGEFGVTPDITTLGKAIGGGMPISAVVGKAEIMDVLNSGSVHGGTTMSAGTYTGHFLSVQGLVTTLEILERNNGAAYQEIKRVQKNLLTGLSEIARRRGVSLRLQGLTGMTMMRFGADPNTILYTNDDGPADGELIGKFWRYMREHGVQFTIDRLLFCTAHTDQDTEIVLDAADKAMARI